MTGWTRSLRLVSLVVLMVLLYFVVPVPDRVHVGTVIRGVLTLLGLVVLAVGLVVQLRRHVDDLDRRADGLVTGIVLVVLVFAFSFYLLDRRQPDQVEGLQTRVDALYFTMTTLTTVGYGDIHAVGQGARILVLIQMIFNVVIVAAAAGLLSSRVKSAVKSRARRKGLPPDALPPMDVDGGEP